MNIPTPWKISVTLHRACDVTDANGDHVLIDVDQDTAALVIHRVNHYEALRSALEELVNACGNGRYDGKYWSVVDELKAARAALKEAQQ